MFAIARSAPRIHTSFLAFATAAVALASAARAEAPFGLSTTTTLDCAPNPSTFSQLVTCTATVTSGGGTPTGNVAFVDTTSGTALGTIALNAAGQAVLTTGTLSSGLRALVANYLGGPGFDPSSGGFTQTVNQAATTAALSCAPDPSTFGQPVTCTATVSSAPPALATPVGTVIFVDTTGGTTLGSATLNVAGVATLSVNSIPVGARALVATYNGTANFVSSASPPFVQDVSQGTTTTNLSGTPNPSVFGEPVTFTATVTANAPSTLPPAGSVTFVDTTTGTTLGTTALNASSQAVLITSSLAPGSHNLQATYNGSAGYATSSDSFTQTVNAGTTTTTLAGSPNPSVFGEPVTFTATVTANAPSTLPPTGSVTFVDTSTATTLGTVALDAGGQATLTTSALGVGSHLLEATYNPDSPGYLGSSDSFSQTVNAAATTTDLTCNPNPALFGTTVTCTATVGAAGPPPTGTVTFQVDGSPAGTVPLDAGGSAELVLPPLAPGEYVIGASYSGDANHLPSVAPDLTLVVRSILEIPTLSVWGAAGLALLLLASAWLRLRRRSAS